jgi:hypothetical protein
MKKNWLLFPVIVVLAFASASKAMMDDTRLGDNVGISDVSGGEKTNPLWESETGNDEFRVALRGALDSAGLLERAKGEGRYSLSAVLEKIDLPTVCLSANIQVKYTLTDKKHKMKVYQETLASEYEMKVWDSIMRPKGMRKASKGAIQTNTRQLAERLSHLNFFLVQVTP